jgi:DNA-directed RNA polymerase subunit RPC12/RpoP
MTDGIPDAFVPDHAERLGDGDYNPYRELDYSQIPAADAIDCPDCGSAMIFAKKLKTEPMDSDAKFTSYRCADCTALEITTESDVDPASEGASILKAIVEMDARGRDGGTR